MLATATVALLAAGCGGDSSPPRPDAPLYDAAAELGLPDEALGGLDLPFNQAGGASVADYDGDGWLDLYVTRSAGPDRLYRNVDGEQFDDVTEAAGLRIDSPSGGSTWADVDGDGCLDLYVTSIGPAPSRLQMSNCDGTFREEAARRGVDLPPPDRDEQFPNSLVYGAAFGDIDRDGDLDLFTSQWRLREQDTDELANRNRLFRNDGDGFFTGVTGSALPADMDASSFTATFADVDDDGWDDLLIAADFGTSRVLVNDGAGGFADRTRAFRAGTDENGMGSVVTDLDGDGRLDWFVTSIFRPPTSCDPAPTALEGCSGNRLFLGGPRFVDATDDFGVREGYWGWGAAAFDVDNDGDLDLAQTNQSVHPDRDGGNRDPNLLWRNDEGDHVEVAEALGFAGRGSGKSLIPFDLDRDGDLDVVVTNTHTGVDLYRNEAAADPAAGWLTVRLDDAGPNRFGIGARVEVQATPAGPVQRRDLRAGDTYLGSRPPEAHVGLGGHTGPVHEVVVTWPDTRERQVLRDVDANRVLTVTRG